MKKLILLLMLLVLPVIASAEAGDFLMGAVVGSLLTESSQQESHPKQDLTTVLLDNQFVPPQYDPAVQVPGPTIYPMNGLWYSWDGNRITYYVKTANSFYTQILNVPEKTYIRVVVGQTVNPYVDVVWHGNYANPITFYVPAFPEKK